MQNLSSKMLSLLERLAEMFPKQNYQSRLEQYIMSKYPTNTADVDYWISVYQHEEKQWNYQ